MSRFTNAVEDWRLMDTVLISSSVDQMFRQSGFYTSYGQLGSQSIIPFFNVRNRAIGQMYCNLDSANKLPFVFHLESIGVAFESPMISYGAIQENQGPSDLFFASEIPKHVGVILRVSQDEKLVQTAYFLPDGAGVSGFTTLLERDAAPAGGNSPRSIQALSVGPADPGCRFCFENALSMPREVNFDVQLILSDYARAALLKMSGPGDYIHDVSGIVATPAAALIRVTLYGLREVQQRSELFFQSPTASGES